ncbi:MAG: calcium-binding protein [Terriglobia bacterium]
MLVLIHWRRRKMAVPLSQLTALGADPSTTEAIGDWHYWVPQGYQSELTPAATIQNASLVKSKRI